VNSKWPTRRLADITLATETATPQKRPNAEFDYIDVSSVSNTSFEITETQTLLGKHAPSRARRRVNTNDVLFATIRPTLKRIAMIPAALHDAICSTGFIVLRANADLLPRFLFYFLQTAAFISSVAALQKGASYPAVTDGDVRNQAVPVPPLPEQRRIVAILDEAFEGIAAAKANAEGNLQKAKTACDAATASHLEHSTADCPVQTVADLAQPHKGSIRTGPFGSQLLHSEFVDDGVAVLGIDNAVSNEFQWGKRRFITPEKYCSLQRYTVKPGDVVITIMGTCGRCAVIPEDIPLSINSKHLCCISLDQRKCLPAFLHAYFLMHPSARRYLTEQASGSIMDGLNMGIIKEMPVQLPRIEVQKATVATLQGLQREASNAARVFSAKATALDKLKASLLHQAFTGQL